MLSEALRLIRVFHDMKQTELADRLSISNSYLSEIEGGKKQPKIELIQRYSSEFRDTQLINLVLRRELRDPLKVGHRCGQSKGRDWQEGDQFLEAG